MGRRSKNPLCPGLAPFCTPKKVLKSLEANLGSNKSNCCVTRKVKLEVEKDGQTINHKLKIVFTNQDNEQNKKWGERYLANIRLFVNDEIIERWVNILPGGANRQF